jgi:hypothetical protein
MHAALTVKVMKAAASSSHERRADADPSLNILSVALPSPFHAGGHSAFFNAADIMSKAVLPARMILPGRRSLAAGGKNADAIAPPVFP